MNNEDMTEFSKIGMIFGLCMVCLPILGINSWSLYFAMIGFIICILSATIYALLIPIKRDIEVDVIKPKLIIIRGLPGSGKSTLANLLKGEIGIIHSVDDFFMKDGVYKFEEEKLSEYHDLNLYAAIESMEKGITPIIIDNTNLISIWCFSYVSEANLYDYVVSVEETQTPWRFDVEELFRRNIHGIPKERLQTMKDMYEPLEKFKENLGI